MGEDSTSGRGRWLARLFPRTPDFYACLNAQCDLTVAAIEALVAYMRQPDDDTAKRVLELEKQGDALKATNMTTLHQAFATPIDREDIYRSIAAIDEILNYAKATVREMRALKLRPDEHTRAMAELMYRGASALQQGYASLAKDPLTAERHADAARKTERATERIYRRALRELFDVEHYHATLTPDQRRSAAALAVLADGVDASETSAIGSAVGFVLEILKRREVYRHMSNGADRVARAGEVLHDIVAKVA
ncbi:DUF47 domain-containing protein [Salinisphaera hydrothermalis]|uniref:Phosphate transport regulator-like protein n=1 Tax=Salinisphaera hydrothermalis (strain C41B8) TaxID=1304275 RepID=A0A084IJ49_SALHC|nr:DUF47 family protein [Salinisphaera hydrothermalis]KEZ76733.1 phosphate transport regulator-like protein [Salinisphaera hydrothermalis C41B8]